MLKKLYTILFFLGLFFIGFNEFEGLSFLGEFQSEAGAFFFLAGFFVLVLHGKIGVPIKSSYYQLVLYFVIWCVVCTLINLPVVIESYFKQTYGLNRFLRQYISLLISTIVFFLLYWNVIKDMSIRDILLKVRRVFFWSLVVASVYGFLETLFTVFHIAAVYPLLNMLSYLPFMEVRVHPERISSFAHEAPFLAIYLITIAGWMFSYILTEKGWFKFIPGLAVLVLTYFSGSRTGLLVIFIQLLVFLTVLYKIENYRKYILYAGVFMMAGTIGLLAYNAEKVIKSVETKLESLDFSGNLTNNISNQSRFGMQYASIQVFKEHPVVGVGYGQQSYHNRFHYPKWATKKNWEFVYLYKNPKEPSFPPGYNIYTRLLAETGIIGFGLWVWIVYLVIAASRRMLKNREGDEKIMALILFISFIGLAINWLQIDAFRMYGFWLCLAILIKLVNYKSTVVNE
ncbi:MAG: polymerase [Flavobacterium psychrophilum]|nr:MAG: polymerase [Flavobacterium psychrophilum]